MIQQKGNMYAHNCDSGRYAPPAHGTAPAYAPNTACAFTAPVPSPLAAPSPLPFQTQAVSSPAHTPSPSHVLPPSPVQVPPGCHPIELVQFWRDEYKHGQPLPLHWALFVRTAPPLPATQTRARRRPAVSGSATTSPPTTTTNADTGRGNFYELVGTPETYTAQFLPNVPFDPTTLVDWRGTHVVGWVHPAQLTLFEGAVRQVPVWRRRPDWRCQQWVYDVIRAVGGCLGVYVMETSFGGLQRHMGRLLDAWESGDI